MKQPIEIAEAWYSLESVQSHLYRNAELPPETDTVEFAEWLREEFKAAMAKGIQIGRGDKKVFLDELAKEAQRLGLGY
jgi:hypothetical protein